MTRAEFKNLQPGDKIFYSNPTSGDSIESIKIILKAQSANGGCLTVKGHASFHRISVEEIDNTFLPEWVERYCNSNSCWSYGINYR